MTFLSPRNWLKPWQRQSKVCRRFARRPYRASRSLRLQLEALEERLVPATNPYNPVDTAGLIFALQAAANGPATDTSIINLQAGTTYLLTSVNNSWYGPDGLPPINSTVIIHGNGATIARDSNPADNTPDFRLFYVSGGMELTPGSLTMDNVTLKGGIAKGGDSSYGGGGMGAGGAIFNQGTLTLTDVTLTNNEALGGSSGVGTNAYGGGGMGSSADNNGDGVGGGFGGTFPSGYGGSAGSGTTNGGGGGGGGFLAGANGRNGTDIGGGNGGGQGDFGGDGGGGNVAGSGGDGGGGYGGGDGGFGGGGGIGGSSLLGLGGNGGQAGPGGSGGGGAGCGGALFNMGADFTDAASGRATLVNCTLTTNIAHGGDGGGTGTINVGGAGIGAGGGLFNLDGALTLTNDTLARNAAAAGSGAPAFNFNGLGIPSAGGAVFNLSDGNDIDTGNHAHATFVLNNSILANNSASSKSGGLDLFSFAEVSGSNNLVMSSAGLPIDSGVITLSSDPQLGPLQNNGGLTPTMLPSSGSAAFGAGNPALAPSTDQRGQARPPNGPTDLGAVQLSQPPTGDGGGGSNGGGGGSNGGGGSGATQAPPSLIQAVFSLFFDGIYLEIDLLEAGSLDSSGITPEATGAFPILTTLDHFLGDPNSSALQADINFNMTYAGPFGPFVEMLGESEIKQILPPQLL